MSEHIETLKFRLSCAESVIDGAKDSSPEHERRQFHAGRAAGIREALEVLGVIQEEPRNPAFSAPGPRTHRAVGFRGMEATHSTVK